MCAVLIAVDELRSSVDLGDIARGDGEYLAAFAMLSGVSDAIAVQGFAAELQAHYVELQAVDNITVSFTATVDRLARSDS